MYKLKSIVRRGTNLSAAIALTLGAIIPAVVPATSAYADSLNPLTNRSLTLSSSSPGWSYTDGSGNSTYAPPNSGANGQKTGNYFDFKVSSSATVKALSFQYCTTSAGNCEIPGNDSTRGTDTSSTTDLNVNYTTAAEISNTDNAGTGTIDVTSGGKAVVGTGTAFTTELKVGSTIKTAGGNLYRIADIADDTHLTLTANAGATETGVAFSMSDFLQVIDPATGKVKAVPGYVNSNPKYQFDGGTGDVSEAAKDVAGNYIVMYDNAGTWTQSTGWTVAAAKVTDGTGTTNNYITLTNSTGAALTAGQEVKVLFFATGSDYITNPGDGAFFVKINTYDAETLTGNVPDGNIIDGGVTVANVMNQSIQITTKVLETMQFSVGTVDPDTLDDTQLAAAPGGLSEHTPCNTIMTRLTSGGTENNVLQLGDQTAESSLSTTETYATHSYWRLSSNSSAGATVYYSGHTLSNTAGDEIAPIGTTAKVSAQGSEQFGLALDTATYAGGNGFDDTTYGVDYTTAGTNENAADNTAAGVVAANAGNAGAGDPILGVDNTVFVDNGATNAPTDYIGLNKSFHMPTLSPLVPSAAYAGGSGTIDNSGTAAFAFDPQSDTVPAAIASESAQVVDCVTGKMRYMANIAATTPAGIYTTKVNYIAAPQY